MKILRLQSIGATGVPDGTYDFSKAPDQAHDWVFVTGAEGTGKTRLLELVVAVREMVAPSGIDLDQESWVRTGNRSAKATVTWLLSEQECAAIGASGPVVETEAIFCADPRVAGKPHVDPGLLYLLEAYAHDDKSSKLEYFAESRRLDFGGGEVSLGVKRQRSLRGSKSARKFAWIPAFLSTLGGASPSARRFGATLERLSATCRYDLEQSKLLSHGDAVGDLTQLSSSEADALIFAATATLVHLSRSIVLVDRPELFGGDSARILSGLQALGEDNQLFVATSCPDLLASDVERRVVRLDASAPVA